MKKEIQDQNNDGMRDAWIETKSIQMVGFEGNVGHYVFGEGQVHP